MVAIDMSSNCCDFRRTENRCAKVRLTSRRYCIVRVYVDCIIIICLMCISLYVYYRIAASARLEGIKESMEVVVSILFKCSVIFLSSVIYSFSLVIGRIF